MSLSLSSSVSALTSNLTASFQATGGTEPYAYAVLPGGAGGTINPTTGVYSAPASIQSDPRKAYDTIQVTDDDGAMATLPILVTTYLGLFCDIIQKQMSLSDGRVYIYNQKINEPTDNGLFIAVGILNAKPFANSIRYESDGDDVMNAVQSVNMNVTLDLSVISRDTSALFRKEEVIMALNSLYAQQQQEANSFCIGKISTSFVNISGIDGAAIPYRFNISVNMQYFIKKVTPVGFFDDYDTTEVTTES